LSDEPNHFVVSEGEVGLRLDLFLARRLKLSRREAQRLLANHAIRIDGRPEHRKGMIVSPNQLIEISDFEPGELSKVLLRPDLPLTILASGDGWIAVDKPAGMAVHPLRPEESDTLLNAAIARYPQIQNVGEGGLRSGVVHRLDIDTSGVILLATERAVWERLRRAFQEHHAKKIYRAIVAGKLTGSDRLVLDLVVAQHSPARVKVVDETIIPKPPGTRRCDLTYRAIASAPARNIAGGQRPPEFPGLVESRLLTGATLLEINLGTGFLHQIRATLAHIGHPVLGDKTYGQSDPDIPRQMLHARSIRIGEIYAESPEPADFVQTLSLRRLNE
jgi:23S rRNA pseudouridine1911/1915/1917 synthase